MKFRHLHPLSLILFYKDELHILILLGISIFTWSRWFSLLILLFMLFHPLVRYFTYFYAILDDELYIRSGLIFKKQNHIPYNRIQTIQRRQWFFLQPFDLEEVIIDTASHDKHSNDVILRAVKNTVAKDIEHRHQIATGKDKSIDSRRKENDNVTDEGVATSVDNNERKASQVDAYYQINKRDMNIFALTSTNILFGSIIVERLLNQTHFFTKGINNYLAHLTFASVFQAIISFLILIIILMVINYIQIQFRYFHFTVQKQNGYLLITRGLVQRSTIKIPMKRIQAIEFKQSILRQIFHLVTVQVDVIANQGGSDKNREITVMPVINEKRLYAVMQTFFQNIPESEPKLTKTPNFSNWLFIRNGFLITLVPFIIVGLFYRGIFIWPFLGIFLLIAILNGWYKGRNTQINLIKTLKHPQLVMQTSYLFSRRQVLVDWHHIQSMRIRESVWMKKRRLGHLHISIRNSNSGKTITARYLTHKQYQPIYDWYRRIY